MGYQGGDILEPKKTSDGEIRPKPFRLHDHPEVQLRVWLDQFSPREKGQKAKVLGLVDKISDGSRVRQR
jgi:hypothetical protein